MPATCFSCLAPVASSVLGLILKAPLPCACAWPPVRPLPSKLVVWAEGSSLPRPSAGARLRKARRVHRSHPACHSHSHTARSGAGCHLHVQDPLLPAVDTARGFPRPLAEPPEKAEYHCCLRKWKAERGRGGSTEGVPVGTQPAAQVATCLFRPL